MTNHWVDIKNTDLAIIMGGNAAEAHPCGFKWVVEAKKERKAKLVVVDPRFTRSAAVADFYAPIRAGTDIAFLGGVINYLLSNDKIHHDYVRNYTNAPFLIDAGFKFDDGLFSGYNAEKRGYDKSTWSYQKDKDGFAMVDMTLQDPNCVFQLMKKHYSRYTPELVSKTTGTPKEDFLKICGMMAETAAPNKTMTVLYALGWTEHTVGSQNIRTMAMIQLLLGNMGMAGGGINALRGHANVQGITDMCLYSEVLPGYLSAPTDADKTRDEYLAKRTPKALRPNQMNFPQNFPKWFTSLMKAFYGNAATKDNGFCYDWVPKKDGAYDAMAIFERMHQGKMQGFACQGFNPLASMANKRKIGDALAKLKYLVIIDPLATDTSEFWKNHGEFNEVDASKVQTEVFRLPANLFAEESGSFTNSGRVVQWHWKAADGPGESKGDSEIMAALFLKLKEMYAKDGGKFPDAILNLAWPYRQPAKPAPEELLMEISGKALADVTDPKDATKVLVKAGEQVPGFIHAARRRLHRLRQLDLRRFLVAGRQSHRAARRLRSVRPRPDAQLGFRLAGQPAHPLQPRLGRPRGQAVGSEAHGDEVDRHRLGRQRHPRHAAERRAGRKRHAVHHGAGRRGAAVLADHGRRAVPRALRAVRVAARQQPLPPWQRQGEEQPGGKGVQERHGQLRHGQGLPLRCHHLPPGRALPLLDQARPHQRRAAARALRRDRRGAGEGEGHQGRRQGEGAQQPRPHQGGGGGDQAPPHPRRGREKGAYHRHPAALRFQGGDQAGLHHQHPDAVRRRRQFADAGVQGVPGQHRESLREEPWHCNR
jgi:hypothetical protein